MPIKQFAKNVLESWDTEKLGCLYQINYNARYRHEEFSQLELITEVLCQRPYHELLPIFHEITGHISACAGNPENVAFYRQMKDHFYFHILG